MYSVSIVKNCSHTDRDKGLDGYAQVHRLTRAFHEELCELGHFCTFHGFEFNGHVTVVVACEAIAFRIGQLVEPLFEIFNRQFHKVLHVG